MASSWRDLPTLHTHPFPAPTARHRRMENHAFNVTSAETIGQEWDNRRLTLLGADAQPTQVREFRKDHP